MIEKMKFLSITGPKSDIDRVVNEYLAKYEIHLENAMAQLTQVQHLSPYIQINPYTELLNKATEFAGLLQNTEDVPVRDISLDEATGLIDSLSQKLSDINAECDDLKAQRTAVVEDLNRITPFLNLPEDVDKLVWIPGFIHAMRMNMYGASISCPGPRWRKWTRFSLPCILKESI